MTQRQTITRSEFDSAIRTITAIQEFENPTPAYNGFSNGHLQSTIKTLTRYRDYWSAPETPAPAAAAAPRRRRRRPPQRSRH